MRIIADTPTLFSASEGKALGITIIPACTIIDGRVYRDYEDISSEEFLKKIEEGAIPTTSQPAIGDILEVYEESKEEVLVLPIGDGLSGTYQNMVGAKNMMDNNENIQVLDTKTLAGPQRYLVKKALELAKAGENIETIKRKLKKCIDTSVSFVIPADFNFLKRSGRLTPIAAKLGTLIKIVPVMTQTEDKKKITPFTIKRSKKKAVIAIIEHLKSIGVDKDYLISISHGGVKKDAEQVAEQMNMHFPETEIETFLLAPSLVSHGGPGCLVVQTIRKE